MIEDVTDPHYWKNPSLRRSREKKNEMVAGKQFLGKTPTR